MLDALSYLKAARAIGVPAALEVSRSGIGAHVIPHDELMQAIEERVCDRSVLKLLRAILRAGVMEDGGARKPVTGAAQGGVINPLLCNVYLHCIDRMWSIREHGVLVRFADDVVVMCRSREQAEAALQRLRVLLAELGLRPKKPRPGSCAWRPVGKA